MKQTFLKDFMALEPFKHELTACIGYFDGLHLGHQVLINETIRIAKETGTESCLITFSPDPWTVINNKSHVNHLTPVKDKIRIAESLGVDHYVTINFDKDTAKLTPQEFIEKILVRINVRHLVCGADFKFGHRGSGDVAYLQTNAHYFFDTHVIEIDKFENHKIGTTEIIQAILRGNVDEANAMLGRDYHLNGFVVHGAKQGRKIGFPTANLDVVDEYVIPATGIYAGYTWIDGTPYMSAVNVGYNPTFNTNDHVRIESHILDFEGDLYGKNIRQSFVKRLRPEMKFDSIEELVKQMEKDVLEARSILNERLMQGDI